MSSCKCIHIILILLITSTSLNNAYPNTADCQCFNLYLFNIRPKPDFDDIYCYEYNIIKTEQPSNGSCCNTNLQYIGFDFCPENYQYIHSLQDPINHIIDVIYLFKNGTRSKPNQLQLIQQHDQSMGINIDINDSDGIVLCLKQTNKTYTSGITRYKAGNNTEYRCIANNTSNHAGFPCIDTIPEPIQTPSIDTTKDPIELPIDDIKPICNGDGNMYEYAILVDNSCGLDSNSCRNQIDMASHLVYNLKNSNYKNLKSNVNITYISFDENVRIIIPLNERYYQDDIGNIMGEIRYGFADCGKDSDGDTDLVSAIQVAVNELTVFGNRESIKRLVVISNCMDNSNELCDDIRYLLDRIGIHVYLVNIAAGNASNKLSLEESIEYGSCLVNDDMNRICNGNGDDIVTEDEVKNIADNCVLPIICDVNMGNIISAHQPIPLRRDCDVLSGSYYDNLYGNKYMIEYAILYDNSCGMIQSKCDQMMNGIGDIIMRLLGNTDKSTVSTLSFTETSDVNVLVGFKDEELQKNGKIYFEYIKEYGSCIDGGNGKTDIQSGIYKAMEEFTKLEYINSNNYIRKMIIISSCIDNEEERICNDISPILNEKNIDLYIVNIKNSSYANNVITTDKMDKYLSCLITDDYGNSLCEGSDFEKIAKECLVPALCTTPDIPSWRITEPTPFPTTTTKINVMEDDNYWTQRFQQWQKRKDDEESFYFAKTNNEEILDDIDVNDTDIIIIDDIGSTLNENKVKFTDHDLQRKFEQYELKQYRHWIRVGVIIFVLINIIIGLCACFYFIWKRRKLQQNSNMGLIFSLTRKAKAIGMTTSSSSDCYDDTTSSEPYSDDYQ